MRKNHVRCHAALDELEHRFDIFGDCRIDAHNANVVANILNDERCKFIIVILQQNLNVGIDPTGRSMDVLQAATSDVKIASNVIEFNSDR